MLLAPHLVIGIEFLLEVLFQMNDSLLQILSRGNTVLWFYPQLLRLSGFVWNNKTGSGKMTVNPPRNLIFSVIISRAGRF